MFSSFLATLGCFAESNDDVEDVEITIDPNPYCGDRVLYHKIKIPQSSSMHLQTDTVTSINSALLSSDLNWLGDDTYTYM